MRAFGKNDNQVAFWVPRAGCLETVRVYQPAAPPVLYNKQELSGDPHLPGFRVPVAALFGR